MSARPPFRPRGAYPHWTELTTRWGDNDLYGHVNNVVHYSWFDTAVNAWLIGEGLLDLHGGEVVGLVVESGCRYAYPLAYPQRVEVGLAVERIGGSSVVYQLGVFSPGAHAAAAEGGFTHVYVSREGRRPRPLDARWRQRLARLQAVADGG